MLCWKRSTLRFQPFRFCCRHFPKPKN
jgi:hypothetical protein